MEKIDIVLLNIMERIPYYIFWKSTDSIYLGCNQRFIHFVGKKSASDIVGKTDFELGWGEGEPDNFRKGDQAVMNGSPLINIEEILIRPDGEKIVMLVSKVPLRDEHNNCIGILGISTDITDHKKLEENLQASMLATESANRAKAEFIANMSHDIRTPIAGIFGMVQDMMQAADTAKKSDEPIEKILNNLTQTIDEDGAILMSATDELLQFFNEVIDVVRLESGHLDVASLESFSLQELVTHNIEFLKTVAKNKNLSLASKMDAHVPTFVTGYRTYIDRVVLNLLANALKFTETGSVDITISLIDTKNCHGQVGDKVNVQIKVKDTGIGIPSDKFDLIFENFSRLSPSYTGIYKGAGLGLYTVQRYIQAMNGAISVESEVGKGSCFIVTIPLTVADHSDIIKKSVNPMRAPVDVVTPKKDEIKNIQAAPSSQSTKAHILLVEDTFVAACAVKALLKPYHCTLDVAETGMKAVQLAQENHYDLIFMDVGLPDIDGIEVTRRIRAIADARKSQVPIVALTGHANNPETRQQAFTAGMQEVMSKPADPQLLKQYLNTYIFDAQRAKAKNIQTLCKTQALKSIIDWQETTKRYDMGDDFVEEMLGLFVVEIEQFKGLFAAAFSNRNAKRLREELHRIRGSASYLVLPNLSHALEVFHVTVKTNWGEDKKLKDAYDHVIKAMDDFLKAVN